MSNETLFHKIKTKLIMHCANVNDNAVEKDMQRNRVNYGCATAYANILCELGHDVDVAVWEDDGYLKVPVIEFDGKRIEMI